MLVAVDEDGIRASERDYATARVAGHVAAALEEHRRSMRSTLSRRSLKCASQGAGMIACMGACSSMRATWCERLACMPLTPGGGYGGAIYRQVGQGEPEGVFQYCSPAWRARPQVEEHAVVQCSVHRDAQRTFWHEGAAL